MFKNVFKPLIPSLKVQTHSRCHLGSLSIPSPSQPQLLPDVECHVQYQHLYQLREVSALIHHLGCRRTPSQP